MSVGTVVNGRCQVVARCSSNGEPIIAATLSNSEGPRVDHNFAPFRMPDDDLTLSWIGDGDRILCNALAFASSIL